MLSKCLSQMISSRCVSQHARWLLHRTIVEVVLGNCLGKGRLFQYLAGDWMHHLSVTLHHVDRPVPQSWLVNNNPSHGHKRVTRSLTRWILVWSWSGLYQHQFTYASNIWVDNPTSDVTTGYILKWLETGNLPHTWHYNGDHLTTYIYI